MPQPRNDDPEGCPAHEWKSNVMGTFNVNPGMKRESFLLAGAGALLAGCAGGLATPNAATSEKLTERVGQLSTLAYLGEILLVPYDFDPSGFALCDGSVLPTKDFATLFALLGTRFGGNGTTTFGLPNLRGREPVKGLRYVIALYGASPWNDTGNLRYYGELMLTPYDVTPKGWLPCDGSVLPIDKNEVLFSLLGTQFGGNGAKTFGLPDTREHVPATGLKYLISTQGVYPSPGSGGRDRGPQTDVYAAQLLVVPFRTPGGWLPCDGQLLQINNNTALFSLMRNEFGGDGKSTFGVPDLRKHAPIEFLNYILATPGFYPPRS
jgi:microcystin-dependent protein